MDQPELPEWEPNVIDDAIAAAETRLDEERHRGRRRALQLARERAYHRLAVAIDRPTRDEPLPGQLTLFPSDPTLFDA